jgi:hypothetical protein
VIDSGKISDWPGAVTELTDEKGGDLTVDVSGPATFNQTLHAVKVGGAISLMGVLSGLEGPISTSLILHKQIRIQGTYMGSRAMFERMNRAIHAHKMRPWWTGCSTSSQRPRRWATWKGESTWARCAFGFRQPHLKQKAPHRKRCGALDLSEANGARGAAAYFFLAAARFSSIAAWAAARRATGTR